MITARFEQRTPSESPIIVPALMPSEDLEEVAALLGYSLSDLLSIDQPAGFTRHTRIRCLIDASQLPLLYSIPSDGNGAQVDFVMTDGPAYTVIDNLYLLPPRPLMMGGKASAPVNESEFPCELVQGVAIVEAVDRRYWWQYCVTNPYRAGVGPSPSNYAAGWWRDWFQSLQADGRWQYSTIPPSDLLRDAIQDLAYRHGLVNDPSDLIIRSILASEYANILANLNPNTELSVPMMLDMIMSACNMILVPAPQSNVDNPVYQSVDLYRFADSEADVANAIVDDTESTGDGPIVFAGGTERGAFTTSEAVAGGVSNAAYAWWSSADYSRNRPIKWAMLQHPLRAVEGRTYHDNVSGMVCTDTALWSPQSYWAQEKRPTKIDIANPADGGYVDGSVFGNFALDAAALAVRSMNPIPLRPDGVVYGGLYEPELSDIGISSIGNRTAVIPNQPPWKVYDTNPTGEDPWQRVVTRSAIVRSKIPIGRTVMAGWNKCFPHYGVTKRCATIGRFRGQLVPITIMENHEDDWLLGPSGKQITDPEKVFVGSGATSVRKTMFNHYVVDTPAPNTRVFPARIVAAEKLGVSGSKFWQWRYTFAEVSPDTTDAAQKTTYRDYLTADVKMRRGEMDQEPLGLQFTSDATAKTKWQSDYYRPFAMNMTEAGNVFVAVGNTANEIAGGVKQSDYPNSTIEPLPISVGTIVQMVEQFSPYMPESTPVVPWQASYSDALFAPPIRYWFAMPNSVKVSCDTPFAPSGDYGTFDAPTAIYGEYGTFDAPEGSADYGVF